MEATLSPEGRTSTIFCVTVFIRYFLLILAIVDFTDYHRLVVVWDILKVAQEKLPEAEQSVTVPKVENWETAVNEPPPYSHGAWESVLSCKDEEIRSPEATPSEVPDSVEHVMNTASFSIEEDFPVVIISYCTQSCGGRGKVLFSPPTTLKVIYYRSFTQSLAGLYVGSSQCASRERSFFMFPYVS